MAKSPNSPSRTLCIFGKESTAVEIAEAARLAAPDWEIVFVIRDHEEPEDEGMVRDSELSAFLKRRFGDSRFIIPFSDGEARAGMVARAEEMGLWPMTILHPRAYVAPSAKIGPGCYLAPGSVVSSRASLAHHCILNLNVTFGHDSSAGRHFVANPGAAISGKVTFGERVLLGANSFVAAGVRVGEGSRIDALTHVSRDIPANQLCTSRSLQVYPRRDDHG